MARIKIGDLVTCYPLGTPEISAIATGIVVGFNKKGLGGKEFVRVMLGNKVIVFLEFNLEVIS